MADGAGPGRSPDLGTARRRRGRAARGAANDRSMTRPEPSLAKVTPPSAEALLRRERQFAALDRAHAGQVAWVSAPAGAGKTCLAASWVDARETPCLWLTLDRADADPASLFHYLTAAARRLGAAAPAANGPKADPGGFARWFFEELFAAEPDGLVVVLDGYQALPEDAPAHDVVATLVELVPPGSLVVVTSRRGPPPRLARLRASAGFHAIEWPALALAPDEADALAREHGVSEPARLAVVRGLAHGWAAGVVLLARARGEDAPRAGDPDRARQAVADYFASQVLADLPERTRRLLQGTAFLPRITAELARAVIGESAAGEVLDELARAHLFVERRDGEPPVFDLHPLFRCCLKRQARDALGADALGALLARSAAVLEQQLDLESAAALYAAGGDWAALSRTVRRCGDDLAGQGRHAVLAGWIDAVPAAARAAEPWLEHWGGRLRLERGESGAREQLAAAFAAFDAGGDAEGAVSSAAWLLRFSTTPDEAARWIAAIERSVAALAASTSAETEARVIAQLLLVHQFPPHHAVVERFAARAERLARSLEGVAARTRMAAFALGVPALHGDLRRLAALLAETRPLAARGDAPPNDLATLLLLHGYGQLQFDPPAGAAATIARLQTLTEVTGSVGTLAAARSLAFRAAVLEGDVERARECRAQVDAGEPLPLPHAVHAGTLKAYLALLEGEPVRAVAEARAVLAAGGPIMPACGPLWRANLGQALLAQGDAAAALHEIECALAAAREWRLEGVAVSAELLRAAALLHAGDEAAADASLRAGLAAARALGCVPHLPFVVPALLARIAARALARGIERDFVCATIVRRGMPPPAADEERWPWRVRVRALGAFEVTVDGKPLENGARTQRKPIELLKYVVAAGGREVGFGAVAQALWPEAEGDAAKRSFDVTLHRLRRLLGHDEAILLLGGKLALNPGLVWVDATAFERLAARADDEERSAQGAAIELLERALRLYRGPLLESDDAPWAQPARDRLRQRFLQLAEWLGERWEDQADPDAALDWYQRAVGVEPAAERLHQRIIRLLHEQGRTAEAIDAYRRCRDVLAAVLAAPPSAETEALHRRIRGG